MTTISNLGVGSGLDLSSLLDQLSASEQAPLTAIQDQETSYSTKLSAYGQLSSALSGFQSAAAKLGQPDFFNATKIASSNTDVLSASSTTGASPGTYAVDVTALAQAQSLVSAGQAKQDAAIGTGTIHIDFGTISGGTVDTDSSSATYGKYTGATFTAKAGSTGVDINIDSSHNSLEGIRDAINAANAGVTATILNDGSGSPYRLVLSANDTGAANSMRISATSSDGTNALAGLVANDPAGTQNLDQTVAARDATLSVNNIAIQSASNQVSAIQGLTMSLSQTGTSVVSVQHDTAAIESGVQAFVTAYNSLQSTETSLSAFDPTAAQGQQASPLTGDGVLRNIQTQVREALDTPQAGGTDALTVLSQVGVAFQTDGTLSLDTGKLSTAMTSNMAGVAALFSNSDGKTGYGNVIGNLVSAMTGTNGALTSATDGINRTLKDLSTQYDSTQSMVNETIDNYRQQFTQLDVIMSQMKNTSSYLTQQLGSASSSG